VAEVRALVQPIVVEGYPDIANHGGNRRCYSKRTLQPQTE
jgi:hypothetical protein